MNLNWHIIITHRPEFILCFTFNIIHWMGFEKCIMTCIHHYGIIQSVFTALKILCALLFIPPPPTNTNLWQPLLFFFYCLHSFPFPECYMVEIIQYVVFKYWLLSLSNTQSVSFRSFHALIAYFFLVLSNIPQIIYPFTYFFKMYWRTSCLLESFVN